MANNKDKPEDEDLEAEIPEEELLEEEDGFQYHNPDCINCGSRNYTACNVDEEGNVVVCDKCPTTKWLH